MTFIKALTEHGQSARSWTLSAVMCRSDSYEMVEMALMRLQESGAKTLPVTHGGQLVGMVIRCRKHHRISDDPLRIEHSQQECSSILL
jgi:hypothetical protein